ncbi:MAG: Mov34/MPN/PAD-1 family protein [Nostoc sp.]|uniref:Mov34/MPN/PAD-1 family protein n=1 Tax=Nostoc sp. TaxID=1180 RepID=UPI002FFCC10B
MTGEIDSSNFPDHNNPQGRSISNSPSPHQIVWVDSEDVYKPIPKSFREFTEERGITFQQAQVYIKEDALRNLTKHLKSNLRVEQGGILFGNAYQDPSSQTIYVEITAAVAAPATIGTSAHLDFTPDSWTGIMDYARVEHPEENIVGWYHSHPNIGVFMSGTDMRTQQAFFYHPWCLSIVCDPVRTTIDYFLGKQAVSVKPVIFGQNSSLVGNINIDWTNESNQSGSRAITTTENKNHYGRKSRPSIRLSKRYIKYLSILLGLLVAITGFFIFQQILSPSKKDLYLQAEIKSMPAPVFTYLQKQQYLLRYPIQDAGKISGGDIIKFLLISPKKSAKVELVQLELQQFNNTSNASISDLIEDSQNIPRQEDFLGEEQKILFDSPEIKDGVIVPLSSAKKINPPNKPQTQVSNIVFIPRRLVYKDSNQKTQKVEIKDLLLDGK